MKTNIFLSIFMLAVIFTGYSETNGSIPMDKVRYAMDHPGTPIVISTSTISTYSRDWLWETKHTKNQVVVYSTDDCKFSSPFDQTSESTTFCWWIMIYVAVGLLGSFLLTWLGYFVGFPVYALYHIIFDNEHVYWWIPLILIIAFVATGFLGYYFKPCKIKQTKNNLKQ